MNLTLHVLTFLVFTYTFYLTQLLKFREEHQQEIPMFLDANTKRITENN